MEEREVERGPTGTTTRSVTELLDSVARDSSGAGATFVRQPGVEPRNSRGERALREVVVVRKIAGTLRERRGAEVLARRMSVLGTWKGKEKDTLARLYAVLS